MQPILCKCSPILVEAKEILEQYLQYLHLVSIMVEVPFLFQLNNKYYFELNEAITFPQFRMMCRVKILMLF